MPLERSGRVSAPRGSWGGLAGGLGVALLIGLAASPAYAASVWRSVKPAKSAGEVCVTSGDAKLTYHRLDDRSPLEFTVSGPRSVKILTRCLWSDGDPARAGYTVRVVRDGVEILRKAIFTARSEESSLCGNAGRGVGKIRRISLEVPKGRHTYQVFVVGGGREAAARVFRKVNARKVETASLTPSEYSSICTVQFESGALSKYYGFRSDRPLRFEVVGPTKIKVCTRLEFDRTMAGSRSYGVQVVEDGKPLRVFQYQVKTMKTAVYLELPESLPGERKCFSIRVPKGRHAYELRPADRSGNSVAARIYIPKTDLGKGR